MGKKFNLFQRDFGNGGEPQDKMGDAYFQNKLSLSDIAKIQSTQEEDSTTIKVNKDGWVDKKYYQENKENKEIIGSTQDYLIGKGFDIVPDSTWGNMTYRTMNEQLVNSQLDNYQNTNFTEDQFLSQIWKESKGDKTVVSPKGAMGIAQFKPATFKELKDKGFLPETAKITDNASSILAQRRYMDQLYEGKITNSKNISSAPTKEERQARSFAAYNWGPTNFDTFWATLTDKEKKGGWRTWYTKTNPETEKYILWMMDKKKYKTENSTLYKHRKGYMTSKWNDVNYGFEQWKATNPTYRY